MFNKQEKQKLLVNNVIKGDVLNILKTFPTNCIDTIITSPPYWALRKYGDDNNELGQEQTFQEYVEKLVEIFDEVWRVLKKEGTCWVNISDTYISQGASRHIGYADPKNSKVGIKNYIEPSALPQSIQQKCLANIPHRFAIAMTDRGWIHRNTIIWYKRNAMPSSVKDRFTVDYEPVFFFTKQQKYYFEQQFEPYLSPMNRWGGEQVKKYTGKFSIGADVEKYNSPRARQMRLNYPERERSLRPNTNGKNMRCVWDLPTKPSNVAHFAMYPEKLVERMIKAGCPEFVCNKCGKARERIIKKIKHEQIEIYNGKATKDYDKHKRKIRAIQKEGFWNL
jgi:site-specific DNA-methyltransferase (adenine-specific)